MSENSTESTQDRSPAKDEIQCVVCGGADDAANMPLCDKCDKAYHIRCIGLAAVPEEDVWFCTDCIKETDVKSSLTGRSRHTTFCSEGKLLCYRCQTRYERFLRKPESK